MAGEHSVHGGQGQQVRGVSVLQQQARVHHQLAVDEVPRDCGAVAPDEEQQPAPVGGDIHQHEECVVAVREGARVEAPHQPACESQDADTAFAFGSRMTSRSVSVLRGYAPVNTDAGASLSGDCQGVGLREERRFASVARQQEFRGARVVEM